jgi:hypothetical protein
MAVQDTFSGGDDNMSDKHVIHTLFLYGRAAGFDQQEWLSTRCGGRYVELRSNCFSLCTCGIQQQHV